MTIQPFDAITRALAVLITGPGAAALYGDGVRGVVQHAIGDCTVELVDAISTDAGALQVATAPLGSQPVIVLAELADATHLRVRTFALNGAPIGAACSLMVMHRDGPPVASGGAAPAISEGWFSAQILTGETVDVPGPPPGRVRVFPGNIGVTPISGTVPAIPFFLVDAAAVPWQLVGSTPGAASTVQVATASPIGNGEVWRLGPSPGGASPMMITAPYIDLPAESFTLLRLGLNTTPQVVIPAPPPGLARQFYLRDVNMSAISAMGVQIVNRDSISNSFPWRMGGVLAGRNATLASAAQTLPVYPVAGARVTALTGDLDIATTVAPATTQPSFLGAYQTLPIQ